METIVGTALNYHEGSSGSARVQEDRNLFQRINELKRKDKGSGLNIQQDGGNGTNWCQELTGVRSTLLTRSKWSMERLWDGR